MQVKNFLSLKSISWRTSHISMQIYCILLPAVQYSLFIPSTPSMEVRVAASIFTAALYIATLTGLFKRKVAFVYINFQKRNFRAGKCFVFNASYQSRRFTPFPFVSGLSRWLVVKKLPASAGGGDSIPGSLRSPGAGNGHPVQCSCLGSPIDKEPSGLQSVGSHTAGHDLAAEHAHTRAFLSPVWDGACFPILFSVLCVIKF